jgi:catechol 2,3-dioxygenase-like lactoylglutathione lyase family enzyme
MKPAGVHHVAICVADAQNGLAFYRDVLGMTQLPRPDLGPGYWLDAGGQQVHLMESDTQPRGANHFAIRVEDIDAAVTDLREQGVKVHPAERHCGWAFRLIPTSSLQQLCHGDHLVVHLFNFGHQSI